MGRRSKRQEAIDYITDIEEQESMRRVGTKGAKEFGLYDMTGNVWEWCWDWSGSYGSAPQTDPMGPTSGSYRVMRGGYFGVDGDGCHVTVRNKNRPEVSGYFLGFRCVQE